MSRFRSLAKYNQAVDITKREGGGVQGFYRGSRMVEVDGVDPFMVHTIENEEGLKVDVYGFGQLNFYLVGNDENAPEVKEGDFIKITYLGKKKMKGKSQEAHQCDVAIRE